MKILGRLLPFHIVALYAIACCVSGSHAFNGFFPFTFLNYLLLELIWFLKYGCNFRHFWWKVLLILKFPKIRFLPVSFSFPKQSDDPGVLEDTEENLGEFLDLKLYVYFFRITCAQSTHVVR